MQTWHNLHCHSCCTITVTSSVILVHSCTVYSTHSHMVVPLSYDWVNHTMTRLTPWGWGGLNYNMTHGGLICCSKMLAGTICLLIYHLPQQRGEHIITYCSLSLYLDPQAQRWNIKPLSKHDRVPKFNLPPIPKKNDRGGERCTLKQGLSLPKDPASSLCMHGSFF